MAQPREDVLEGKEEIEEIGEALAQWERGTLARFLTKNPERLTEFTTVSGQPIHRLYTPLDVKNPDYQSELGEPGEFPYTRGIYPTMYRGKPWTMRQFAGFGSAEETNRRFHYLLGQGQTGLSIAFHLPTLMGYESDHLRSRGEVGKCGVAVDTLADMEILLDGIPLDQVTTSMTINAPAAILLAMYIAVGEKQGVSPKQLRGTIQNDILKEYIAQKTYIFPPQPSMRIITDIFQYCTAQVPQWNTISISGYHIREAGSTAVQELAFTLADGIAYVEAGIEAGLEVDSFAPRLSFFFNAHNDFFEEIAKYRAARRIWARVMRDRFGAKDPRSWLLRFHTQTAGCSLTAQQPQNNIVRVAIQALAAVLGGTQSLHTNSLDETLALPTEEAVTIALRTQQIIAHETGVTNAIDPFGGSYFLEALTHQMEEGALDYIRRIDEMGGMIAAIERGFPQREIMEASYRYQKAVEDGKKIIVGLNDFQTEEEPPIETLRIGPEVEKTQIARLREVRSGRDHGRVRQALHRVGAAARQGENLMPPILEAVRTYASIGEIVATLKEVFEEYQDPAAF